MRVPKSVVLVVLILLLLPLQPASQEQPTRAPLSKIAPPLDVILTAEGRPGLHQTVTLTARIAPKAAGANLSVRWTLPAGATLAGAPAEALGNAVAGQTYLSQRQVTFEQAGEYQLSVSANMDATDSTSSYGYTDDLYFSIAEHGVSTVSDHGPGLPSAAERIETPNVRVIEGVHPQAGYWVSGRFLFTDVPVSSGGGAGAPVTIPARRVKVEIWEDDPVFDDHDGTTWTDDNGYFTFWVSDNDDGWLGGDKETYLKIFSETPGGYVTDRSWIDDNYYCYTDNQSGGHDLDFGSMTPTNFHRMFSISDALLSLYDYAVQYRGSIDQAKVQYEPGYGEDGSFYDPFWDEVTLADAGGDDGYDDGIVMHEYGHWFAANYACDDSGGGDHSVYGHYDNDLAWSEGWASYLSSVVRDNSWYLDWDFGSSSWSVHVDWEPFATTGSDNEGAVCATLWDIYDSNDESYDHLSLGGEDIWHNVDDGMEDAWYNDLFRSCTIYTFWDKWLEAGYQDDSELAAIFAEHQTAGLHTALAAQDDAPALTGLANAVPGEVLRVGPRYGPDGRTGRPVTFGSAPDTIVSGGLPWNAVLFLPDATNSMADKIGAVRQIIQDKVSSMDAEPNPYEYTVQTFQDTGSNTTIVDHFFPEEVNPPVGAITVGGGGDTPEDSFAALARGTGDKVGYDAWLFTDAPPRLTPSTGELAGLLQSRQVTPYFFIFGDCTGGNLAGATEATAAPALPAPPGRLHLPRFAPDGLEECLEPFLLVAGDTNGQLLLIDTSQIDDAAEIVRAFMSNNAGAGRYANYVSTSWAYRWDDTAYNWYDATATGDYYNIYFDQSAAVSMPYSFSFYNNPYSTLYVADRGYVSFANNPVTGVNTGIPTTATPNNAIYGFWDDIAVYIIGQQKGPCTGAYTEYDTANNRFVIEYCQAYHNDLTEETFEILLDYNTGEITVQYQTVADDSSSTVGVESAGGTQATQVIYNNPGSLYAGRAIKFTPLPPHPSNDHEVVVDSTMGGVIFLLNGYSGSVDMTVYHPDGTPVNPSDPGVTFLDVGKIKYYRVNAPEAGTWIARVSGNGTYYFTSSAASPLDADAEGDRTLTWVLPHVLNVDLGISVTNAAFSLVNPDGSPFAGLDLFDDGLHYDGRAGDGYYGGVYTPTAPGTFNVQVDGQTNGGDTFRRTDLKPIRFQQMELIRPYPWKEFALPGGTIVYDYTLWNDSDELRLFVPSLQSSQGWATTPYVWYLVDPHSSVTVPVTVQVPPGAGRWTETSVLTMLSGDMADSATVLTTVRGEAMTIDMWAIPNRIAPNGHTSTIVMHVLDDAGWNVADGTVVNVTTSLGSLNPAVGQTISGLFTTTLTSDAATGVAYIEATAGPTAGNTHVEIGEAPAYSVTLGADSYLLPPDGASTTLLTAHVYNEYGEPAPDGTTVWFAVEGDDLEMGSISGQEMLTTTTTAGLATATYQSGTHLGWADVYAGIPLGGWASGGEGTLDARWTSIRIQLGGGYNIYLPIVNKGYAR